MTRRQNTVRNLSGRCVLAAGLALAGASPALGQNALGDGRALDKNPLVGGDGQNRSSRSVSANQRFQNAIVTGNAGAGRSFRGDLGYSAETDFRGEAGSDDLFDFARDSFYSGLAARGIRGIDALRSQMTLATGGAPTIDSAASYYAAQGGLSRPAAGTTINDLRTPNANVGSTTLSLPSVDPFTSRPRSLRSTSQLETSLSLESSYYAAGTAQDGQEYVIGGSPLRGITTTPSVSGQPLTFEQVQTIQETQRALQSGAINRLDPLRQDPNRASEPASPEPTASSRAPTQVSAFDSLRAEMERAYSGEDEEQDAADPAADPLDPAATPEPTLPGGQPAGGEDPAAAAPVTTEFSARLETLRQRLLAGRESRGVDDAAPQEAVAADSTEYRRQIRDLLARTTPVVRDLVAPGTDPTVYESRMEAGQEMLEQGQWFDAEERFTSALAERDGDPMASAGRINAQLGAGLFRSATENMHTLFAAHPMFASVRWEASLMPSADRLEVIREQLRAAMTRENEFGRDAAMALAYLGWQTGDADDIRDGFNAIDEIDEHRGADADDLTEMLRAVWSAGDE